MKSVLCAPAPDEGSGLNSGAAPSAQEMMEKAIQYAKANPQPAANAAPGAGPHYGGGGTYDQPGLRYAVLDPVTPPTPMGDKVKQDLKSKVDSLLLTYAQTHIDKMAGNVYYPAPTPDDADFLVLFTEFKTAYEACEAAKDAQKAATAMKDEKRANLELGLSQRGNYVQTASNGNGPVILTSGFDVRSARTPVGVLPPPTNLSLELNGIAGAMALKWSGVPSARAYAIQISPANTMERNWTPYETTTATRYHCENMTLGQTYAFRIAAIGGSTGQSAWSVEVVRMAA